MRQSLILVENENQYTGRGGEWQQAWWKLYSVKQLKLLLTLKLVKANLSTLRGLYGLCIAQLGCM